VTRGSQPSTAARTTHPDSASTSDTKNTTATRGTAALISVCLGFFIIQLDVTIVIVALPAFQREIGGSLAGLQWVVDAYTLALASIMLTAGATADRIGAKKVSRRRYSAAGSRRSRPARRPARRPRRLASSSRPAPCRGSARPRCCPVRSRCSCTSSLTRGHGPGRSACGVRWAHSGSPSARSSAACGSLLGATAAVGKAHPAPSLHVPLSAAAVGFLVAAALAWITARQTLHEVTFAHQSRPGNVACGRSGVNH